MCAYGPNVLGYNDPDVDAAALEQAKKCNCTTSPSYKAVEFAGFFGHSAEEVRALLQSEGDRRVSGARRKWEKETEEAIAGEASKRAAELTASLEAERERLCAELEGERERSRQRERELEIVRLLGERDLPATLLPLIMPARDCAEAVGALADTVASLASRETKRRLSSDAPKAAEKGIKFTSEELRTIPVARLQEMLGAQ